MPISGPVMIASDLLPAGVLDGFSTVAVAVFFSWLIITGRLVPRRTYEDKVEECREYQRRERTREAEMSEKNEQLRHMAEVGKTVEAVMTAVQALRRDDH